MQGTSVQGTPKGEKAAGDGVGDRHRGGLPEPVAASVSSLGASRPRHGVVVVDAMPLYRSGAVAALTAGGVPVVGEAARLAEGVVLAARAHAAALLVGGAEVSQVREAVEALAGCAVVALVSQPSRSALVEMLETGVAGLGPRSLTAEELVSTVEAAAEAAGIELGGAQRPDERLGAPVFVPVLVADAASPGKAHGPDAAEPGTAGARPGAGDVSLTPKELEILTLLQQGASNKKIADALYVTQATVKTHLAHIYTKLGVRGRHEAISRAFALRLLR